MRQSTPHICADCPFFDRQRLECLGFKRGLQGAVSAWMEEQPLDMLRFICKETNEELEKSLWGLSEVGEEDNGEEDNGCWLGVM